MGPDNGLLSLARRRPPAGSSEAVDIARSPFRLEPVSATFHGRDIFAPVAAHLAAGVPLAEAGDPLDPAELVALELPRPAARGGALVAHVRYVDRFGNLQLDAGHEDLAGSGLKLGRVAALRARPAVTSAACTYARTFADVAARASCCSTRTPSGACRWPSATATRPRGSASASTTSCWIPPA